MFTYVVIVIIEPNPNRLSKHAKHKYLAKLEKPIKLLIMFSSFRM